MEVGSVREKIIIALLMYKFGETNIETDLPITEPEADVKLFGRPISIKTITGNSLSGVKLIWTVDAQKARVFSETYSPKCDILLVQINWGGEGGMYYIPLKVQEMIFQEVGRHQYIKLPKPGTNPRGVEITKTALTKLTQAEDSKRIKIEWIRKKEVKVNPYRRWVDLWREESHEA